MDSIVIGIGNPNFGDDGVGFWVVKALEGEVKAVHLLSPSINLLKYLIGHKRAVIVDGVKTGRKPGEIVEFFLEADMNREYYGGLTHSLSLEETITLGYLTYSNRMPELIKFIGVEVDSIDRLDHSLSEPVNKAIPEVIRRIKEFLNCKN